MGAIEIWKRFHVLKEFEDFSTDQAVSKNGPRDAGAVPAGHGPSLAGTVFFPGFRFEMGSGRLWRDDDREVQLRPKTAAVLGYLVGHAGDVVSKQELIEA